MNGHVLLVLVKGLHATSNLKLYTVSRCNFNETDRLFQYPSTLLSSTLIKRQKNKKEFIESKFLFWKNVQI